MLGEIHLSMGFYHKSGELTVYEEEARPSSKALRSARNRDRWWNVWNMMSRDAEHDTYGHAL